MIENKKLNTEEFLAIFETLKDGLMFFDQEGKLFFCNSAAKKFFKIDKEILGKSIVDFADIPNLQYLYFILGKELKEFLKKELKINGLILEVSSLPVYNKEKKISTIVVLHDISREKLIENLKSQFVSISAHQMRTPIASIKWSLEILLKERIGKLNEEQKRIIQKTHNSVERMLSLINDLLNVTKIEEGKYIYKFIPCDFEKLVKSTIEIFYDKIKEKQIKFQLQILPKKIPQIKIDPEKISVVIENLLDNAIRYNVVGGIINIILELEENAIKFSIEDSGIGIPENQQKNIFNKFFRASNAIRTETEGNGLGLFVSKNIIEAHGGKIWFQSKEGKGTIFYFTLPIK